MTKEELLSRTLEDLRKQYPAGLYEYLFKHRPDLDRELSSLVERIDKAYLTETLDNLKSVLREYWKFHMTAIREFKNVDPLALNLPEARQEMQEERIRA